LFGCCLIRLERLFTKSFDQSSTTGIALLAWSWLTPK